MNKEEYLVFLSKIGKYIRISIKKSLYFLKKNIVWVFNRSSLPKWRVDKSTIHIPRSFGLRLVIWAAAITVIIYFAIIGAFTKSVYSNVSAPTRLSSLIEDIFPYPIAVINHHVVPLQRYRWELAARKFYNKEHNLPGTDKEIGLYIMNQISNRLLYKETLDQYKLSISEKQVDGEIEKISKSVGGDGNLEDFLRKNYGPDLSISRFRIWIRETMAEAAIQQQILSKVSVRHIVVSIPDGANEQQIEAARLKAVGIQAKITNIDQFAAVAKDNSDDLASRDNGGTIGTTVRGTKQPDYFTADFENAVFALPVGQISAPIRSSKGWHIVVVDKKDGSIDKSLDAYTKELRDKATIKYYL